MSSTRPAQAGRLGPVGAHAARIGPWFTAAPWAIGAATIAWLLLWARQLPCRSTVVGQAPNAFYRLCYSDIPTLYQHRHLGQGTDPFAMEYPVLTGALVALARAFAALLGAPVGPGTTPQGELTGANLFFGVNAALLFACFLVTVLATALTHRLRPFDALMVAASPVVVATGLINWDMLVVALTALALWAWARRMPWLAGAFLGLGVAAKLYPVLLLVALLPLCLRAQRLRELAQATAAAVVGWAIPNGIVAVVDLKAWLYFWTFNVDRGGDLGSLWYALSLSGRPLGNVSLLVAALDVVGAMGVVTLGLLAPRRPRVGQLAFLMVCWFLVVNKVYSPQYVLWLLPLVVLARPSWRDWTVWTVGELLYFGAVWGHLAQTIPTQLYVAAIVVRVLAQAWVAAMVVRDVLDPRHDPVRAGADDPAGGVLDEAPDAAWFTRLFGVTADDPAPAPAHDPARAHAPARAHDPAPAPADDHPSENPR